MFCSALSGTVMPICKPLIRGSMHMFIYVADREVSGITRDGLAAMQQKEIRICEQYAAEGKPVYYLRSLFLPDEGRCFCLFEAASAKTVQEANEAAGLPFDRIVEAMELLPFSE